MIDKNTFRDLQNQISELKRKNEILRSNPAVNIEEEIGDGDEKLLNTILNNMGDSVFVKDNQSRLIIVNDAFCKIFNLPRSEMLGRTLAEYVPAEERESFLRIDRQVIADGIENITEESMTIGDNETMIVSTRKSRFIDAKGNKFLVGVVRDITSRKKAQQALKNSEIQYKKLNATKDKLLSIIAHDLRSSFHNILLGSDFLLKTLKHKEAEQSNFYLNNINTTGKNALNLLENLLAWAKVQTGLINVKWEKINLSSLIKKQIKLSNSLSESKKISLNYNETGEIDIITDKEMFNTILRNLISNAIKFTNSGKNITISVLPKNDQVEITVSDEGIGIPEKIRKKMFSINSDISILGTEKEPGSGFGLVLCKEFVTKLGGDIWVESIVGVGSDFKFTLPKNV